MANPFKNCSPDSQIWSLTTPSPVVFKARRAVFRDYNDLFEATGNVRIREVAGVKFYSYRKDVKK